MSIVLHARCRWGTAILVLLLCAAVVQSQVGPDRAVYSTDAAGRIIPDPVARHFDLAPDTTTPVVIDDKVYGCWGGLFCLDPNSDLEEVWYGEDEAFDDYASLIGAPGRLLVTTTRGELLLVRAGTDQYDLISRARLFDEDSEVVSHPALVGKRLYVRDNATICCVLLDE